MALLNDTFLANERRQRRLETKFSSLPLDANHPPLSAWDLWGDDDELGTLNLISPYTVKSALKEVERGQTVHLNLELQAFPQPMNPVRKPCVHNIIAKGHANDDEIHINTQGSSHWDGLRHYPYQKTLQYYNGIQQSDISGPAANAKLGIQNVSKSTITGRGVLLDWATWASSNDIEFDPFARVPHRIPLAELLDVATTQGTTFEPGDVLLVRTGWLAAFSRLSVEEKAALPKRSTRSSIGVEASMETMEWHWNSAFAAVASDTVAYEAWPSPRENQYELSLHEVLLSGWGCPIGESFDLERLAERCKELHKWSFFFCSVPLNIINGVASPPGAVAIL